MRKFALGYLLCMFSTCSLMGQENEVDSLINVSTRLLLNGHYERAQSVLEQATGLLETKSDSARWLKGMFQSYTDQSKLYEAQPFGDQAATLYEQFGDTSTWLEVNHTLMVNYVRLGQFEDGLDRCQLAYDLSAAIKDTLEISHYLADFAWIYHDFKQYPLGVEYGKRAIGIVDQYSEAIAFDYKNPLSIVAINFDDWGKPDSALHYHFRNIATKEEWPDTTGLAQIYNNLGNTLMKTGDLSESKKYFLRSLAIYELDKSPYNMATVLTNLATVSYKSKENRLANNYFEEATHYSEKSQSVEKMLDVYYQQYQFRKGIGDTQQAMSYQDKYYQLNDSIFKAETAQKLAAMEVQFDTQKKEQQIILQKTELQGKDLIIQRNTSLIVGLVIILTLGIMLFYLWRKRTKAQQQAILQEQKILLREAQIQSVIQSQEEERQRFATDLHDGIGQLINAIQLNIDGLKNGNGSTSKNGNLFESSQQLLNDMNQEIRNIAFNLMPQILIKEGLIAAINELIRRINQSGQLSIKLQYDGIEERLSERIEISLYRIIQEFISNIIKYSGAKEVLIQFTTDDAEITLTIEDDGTGYDLNSFRNSSGNGWRNINSRLDLIKGELNIDTQPGRQNTTVIIDVPLSNTPLTEFSQA